MDTTEPRSRIRQRMETNAPLQQQRDEGVAHGESHLPADELQQVPMNQTLITAKACYATLVRELSSLPKVTPWEMKRFGASGLMIHDKSFAMLLNTGKLAIKLPQARVNALVERRVGERFELGRKRMKEWLTLEPTSEEDWLHLSREAMEFVASRC